MSKRSFSDLFLPRTDERNPLPPWLGGWKGYWVLGAGVYILIYSSWIFLKWANPDYEPLIAGLGFLPLGIFCAISAVYVTTQKQLDLRIRKSWRFIALSFIFLALADIIYVVLDLTTGVGLPDIPDFFYLAYYPLAFIGFIGIPTIIVDPSQEKTWGLDLAIIVISVSAVFWYFIIAPTAVAGGDNWFTSIIAGAYPAMDILLLGAIARLFFRNSETNTRQSLYILSLGVLFYVIADTIYAWLVLRDLYFDGSWVDLLWTFSYFLIGVAAFRQAGSHSAEPATGITSKIAWQASILPFLAFSISAIVSFYAFSAGNPASLQLVGLIVGTTMSMLLIIARQIVTIRENARLVDELNLASNQLQTNAEALEERVIERTKQLTMTNEVGKVAASSLDLDDLLNRVIQLISEQFGYYYVGIYLMDLSEKWAELKATTSDLADLPLQSRRLEISGKSTVSTAIRERSPQVAQISLGEIQPKEDLLAHTRSEIALPLIVGDRVLGALDVQSTEESDFESQVIATLQSMARQVAIAIENARLFQEAQQVIREMRAVQQQYLQEGWRDYFTHAEEMEYGVGDEVNENSEKLSVPISLRNQVLGQITLEGAEEWTPEQQSLVDAVAAQTAIALENARLMSESRQIALRERMFAEINSKIWASATIDGVLQTVARELGRQLDASQVTVELSLEDRSQAG
jgi:GAF domain-containing protein